MNNRLRELRESMKMSGTKVADMLGISPQYYYNLEKGNKRLNDELILKLSKIFNVPADYIIGAKELDKDFKEKIKNQEVNELEKWKHVIHKAAISGFKPEDFEKIIDTQLELAKKINKRGD